MRENRAWLRPRAADLLKCNEGSGAAAAAWGGGPVATVAAVVRKFEATQEAAKPAVTSVSEMAADGASGQGRLP